MRSLIGDDADRSSAHSGETHDDVGGECVMDRKEFTVIDYV